MENVDIEKIYNENFILVYKFLICLTHNKEISEDLTQETFYRAIMNIDKFNGNCKMSVWLCEIAKNLWLNELKRRKKIVFTDLDTIEIYNQYSIDEEVENKKQIEVWARVNFYRAKQKIKEVGNDV